MKGTREVSLNERGRDERGRDASDRSCTSWYGSCEPADRCEAGLTIDSKGRGEIWPR
jgi:hypothetical protein